MAFQKLPTSTFAEWVSRAIQEDIDQKRSEFWNDSSKIQSFTPPATKLWKAMHAPHWSQHGEPDDFFKKGKYPFAISKGTPESMVTDLAIGQRIVVQPRTKIGKNGRVLKNIKEKQVLRYGTITSRPIRDLDDTEQSEEHPLWYVNVEWDKESVVADSTIRNKPFKTFTLIES